jgi:hypothetical protein
VPKPIALSDDELIARYRLLYPHRPKRVEDVERALRNGGPPAEQMRLRLQARMHDVSQFLKELKQRFTMWFNARHKLFGTIWDGRFKSILVENDTSVLRTVAAYIDLNPLRARLTARPEAYRWCGMGAAERGDPLAQAGFMTLTRMKSWEAATKVYRQYVYDAGLRQVKDKPHGLLNAQDPEIVPESSLLRKQRWISEGWILGSRPFVRKNFDSYIARLHGSIVPSRVHESLAQDGCIALMGKGRKSQSSDNRNPDQVAEPQ